MKKQILIWAVAAMAIHAQKTPDKDLQTAMFGGIRNEKVKAALAAGGNPNGRLYGQPYLSLAATACNTEIVQAFVDKGADVNATTPGGWTALMGASDNGCEPVVKLLISKKADVNAKTRQGRSVLMRTAYHMYDNAPVHLEIMRLLIQAGAKVNDTDNQGNTALTFAAQGGHHEAVRALLEAGADKTLKNKEGKDALAIARTKPYNPAAGEDESNAFMKSQMKQTIALLEGKAETKIGAKIGKVFSVDGAKVEITGEGIGKLSKGQRLVIKNSEGSINITVSETLHSKAKAKITGKGTPRKGDPVHLAK